MRDIPTAVFEFLLQKEDLSNWAVVFPSQRPGFFLDKLLSEKNVVFPPYIFSLKDFWVYLLSSIEDFYPANFEDILVSLKEATVKFIPDMDDWDCFYPWARSIFNCIETIVSAQVPPDRIKQVHNILTAHNEDELYFRLWKHMPEIIKCFYSLLLDKKMYTKSLILTRIAQEFDKLKLDFSGIVFAGLFLESNLEQLLLRRLKERFCCFYILERLNVPVLDKIFDNLESLFRADQVYEAKIDTDKINLIETIGITEEISKIESLLPSQVQAPKQVAIVLPRKEVLLAVVDSLSESGKELNVSMGYPLRLSACWTFVELLFTIVEQIKNGKFYYRSYLDLLSHSYIESLMKENTKGIADLQRYIYDNAVTFISEQEIYQFVDVEIVHRLNECIRKLFASERLKEFCSAVADLLWIILEYNQMFENDLFEQQICYRFYVKFSEIAMSEMGSQQIGLKTILRYVRMSFWNENIAFEGSPLRGIQLMGPVQARNIAFERLFYMDVNEGFCPPNIGIDVLMPDPIRKFLGVPLLKNREILFMYDFYSAICLAKEVFLLYVNYADGRYEKSRFIRQLELIAKKEGKEIKQLDIVYDSTVYSSVKKITERKKHPSDIEKMLRLSPTAIDTYLSCPIRFYYKYILGLKEEQELSEEPKAREVGVLVHSVLAKLYSPVVGKDLSEDFFDEAIGKLRDIINREAVNLLGRQFQNLRTQMIIEVVNRRLEKFVQQEKNRWLKRKFKLYYVERDEEETFDLKLNVSNKEVLLYGRADRIDQYLSGEFVIWDYKTGTAKKTSSTKILREREKRLNARKDFKNYYGSIQLPLYAFLLMQALNIGANKVNAGWIFLKEMEYVLLFNFNKINKDEDRIKLFDLLKEDLTVLLEEMLDLSIPYVADLKECQWCPFRRGCPCL